MENTAAVRGCLQPNMPKHNLWLLGLGGAAGPDRKCVGFLHAEGPAAGKAQPPAATSHGVPGALEECLQMRA